MEGNEDDPVAQEGISRRDRELEANLDHELYVQSIHMFDGASISRRQLKDTSLLR
jgi:hypothetical protein